MKLAVVGLSQIVSADAVHQAPTGGGVASLVYRVAG
jgi:hypothetical protein